jgi:dipeptidyl aminopeptidase/acylaminoacyl peptidase
VEEGTPRYLAGKGGRWHVPVVSPGREWIAFTGQPVGGATTAASELLIMKPDGTGIRRLTVGLDRDVLDLAWRNDREIWFATEERGARNIHHLDITKGKVEVGTSGSHLLSLQAISPRGSFALAVRSTPVIAGELIRFPLDRPANFSALVSPDTPPPIGEIEEFDFRNPSGMALSAWLVRPPDFDPSKRYPLLVDVHGGPHAMAGFGYDPDVLTAAALGWLVLRVNPRGSTGYGFDIRNGLDRRWPGNDVLDIRAAIADVVSRGLADSSRIAVRGAGGGAVTALALRRDEPLVRAAVMRCTGDGWLAGGRGLDAAPWRAWGSSRPFQGSLLSWLPSSPLAGVTDTGIPLLVIDGTSTAPQLLDFGGMVHGLLQRAGTPTAYLRLDSACHAAGPATQARLARTESEWLARARW